MDQFCNVADFIESKVKSHLEKGNSGIWITDGSTNASSTYQEVLNLSKNVTLNLVLMGFKKGDIVIYSATEDVHLLHIFFLGVWRAGGAVRSIYPDETEETFMEKLAESDCKWVLCNGGDVEKWNRAGKLLASNCVTIISTGAVKTEGCLGLGSLCSGFEVKGMENEMKIALNKNYDGDDIALILPTSGTTGKSKGGVYTHKTLIAHFRALERFPMADQPDKTALVIARITHGGGCALSLAQLVNGQRLVVLSVFNNASILRTIEMWNPQGIFTVTNIFLKMANEPDLVKFDTSSIKYVITTGLSTGQSFEAEMKEKFPSLKEVIMFYGMTECAPISTSMDIWGTGPIKNYAGFENLTGSVGKAFPGVEITIRDGQTGNIVEENGIVGEVWVKTDWMISGYFKNDVATKSTIKDGVLNTGDIGYFDQTGFLCLVDRAKETFKYQSNHISPSEIEQIVASHPAVAQVCVVSVPASDGGGEVPRAFVVLRHEFAKYTVQEKDALATKIKEMAHGKLATYKYLRGGLIILDEIPRGKAGKIDKTALKGIHLCQQE